MPIQLSIDDAHTLRLTFSDPWEPVEIIPLVDAERGYRDAFAAAHPRRPIHLIVDYRATRYALPGILRSSRSAALDHPTGGWIVIVGSDATLHMTAQPGLNVLRDQALHIAPTLDSAYRFLAAVTPAPTI